jgi:hypothetical protein
MQETDRVRTRGRTVLASIFLICTVAVAWHATVSGKDVVLSRVFRAEPTRDPDEPTEGEDNAHDIRRHYDYSESTIYPNMNYQNLQDTQRYYSVKKVIYQFYLLQLVVNGSTFSIKRLPGILDKIRTESTKYAQIDRERASIIESIKRLQIKANALYSERSDVKANLAVSNWPLNH